MGTGFVSWRESCWNVGSLVNSKRRIEFSGGEFGVRTES
jgi:hypothetical protein